MLKSLLSTAILATLTLGFAASAQAEMKVGTLDMNNVFTQYYRTKDAETKLNEARASAKRELDDRLETIKKSMDDINKISADIEKPELSKDAKEKAAKSRDEKVAEARNLDREIAEFRGTRERQLQEQFMRMRKDIVDDIMKVVTVKVKEAQYDLVLDKSGMSIGQIPVIVYSKESMDFSKDIIDTLNNGAAKPAEPAKK
ncbi:MAG: OmpH family outer membrane protein [Verrucomicrobia bacterium]|nr:OmpH family outer membrane protein [Verrucomicrobiota bacterium]